LSFAIPAGLIAAILPVDDTGRKPTHGIDA
jgi:hypothetical protein